MLPGCQPSVASAVVLLALNCAVVTVVHEVLVAVWRVRQPSVVADVELLPTVSYVACVVDSHVSNGVEYTLTDCQPSVASAVELLAVY